MSSAEPPDDPPGDETRAFQRFYLEGVQPAQPRPRSVLYRLLVGWWRRPQKPGT